MNDTSWREETTWKPEYAIGDELIDDQHKQLFELAAGLIIACEGGHNHVALGEAQARPIDLRHLSTGPRTNTPTGRAARSNGEFAWNPTGEVSKGRSPDL